MQDHEVRELGVDGWPLPSEYLVELGRIASLWANLESFINVAIGKLAGFDYRDPKSFILVNHVSVPQKLDMLGALCEQLLDEYPHLVRYKEVIGELRAAQQERNRFLHNGMAINDATGQMEMAIGSARGRLKTEVRPVDVIDLKRAWMRIHEAQCALYELILQKELTPIWERDESDGDATDDGKTS